MARTPLQLDPSKQTYGGDPGSAGYQGSTGQNVGSTVGGAIGAIAGGGAPGAAIGGAIGSLLGMIGDLFASGSGSRDPVAAKVKPQLSGRQPAAAVQSSLSDPGSSASGMPHGPAIRLEAAKNIHRSL